MFRKQPSSFCFSENMIRATVIFYFEKFNWSPSHLVKTPNALMYSLDKRVIPRCSVMQVLVSRNIKILSSGEARGCVLGEICQQLQG